MSTGQPMQNETAHVSNEPSFGCNYQNRSFTGAEKNKPKTFTPQLIVPRADPPKNVISFDANVNPFGFQSKPFMPKEHAPPSPMKVTPQASASNVLKKENQNQIMSRADKLQALHKSGPRAFSGPVEKVLKWHKALQDIGVFVFYEIVAKCVSVRPGESCSKNLVIRDDNGPAMQVVYYEIDFLLTELKIPSTVRVIGRMMAGTCRLQAFSVRPATGDDVATLPRRAAVAAHHVTRLCKEYGMNV
ncbi:uncharacterized protein LOC142977759 [Anticarsia gemmatalis]|uniref:uncharacterized protein LOC142977759 n=1 Tax=Anticarsia gemmatalis TaxID=129554 RepID=UPI003F77773B